MDEYGGAGSGSIEGTGQYMDECGGAGSGGIEGTGQYGRVWRGWIRQYRGNWSIWTSVAGLDPAVGVGRRNSSVGFLVGRVEE